MKYSAMRRRNAAFRGIEAVSDYGSAIGEGQAALLPHFALLYYEIHDAKSSGHRLLSVKIC